MRQVLLSLSVIGIVTTCSLENGFAQQQQVRPVTITFRPTSVVSTQWSPDSVSPNTSTSNGTGPNGTNDSGKASPGLLPGANRQSNQFSPGFSSGTAVTGTMKSGYQLPTNQQLQNPSGGFHITHAGFSHSPSMISPNNYFGPQYNSWSNLQLQPANLALFESFNRYQPDVNSGGYYSPNNYTGSMNNQWSNLSTGSPIPNDLGGWSFGP